MASKEIELRRPPLALAEVLADIVPECEHTGLKQYGCAHCNGAVPDFDLKEVLG